MTVQAGAARVVAEKDPEAARRTIALLEVAGRQTLWELRRPGGAPRLGILGFETTRGDRLFVSLLGSAFIHLAWIGLVGIEALWWALAVSLAWAFAVFRWV